MRRARLEPPMRCNCSSFLRVCTTSASGNATLARNREDGKHYEQLDDAESGGRDRITSPQR